jgi:hypothetical protein
MMSGSDEDEENALKSAIRERRSEVNALKRELKGLTQQGSDLREIFAAERTRAGSIPKYWFFIMAVHLVYGLNEWYAFRTPPSGVSHHLVLCVTHMAMFLLYWRRFYLPEKRFTIPMSVWIFIMSWYFQ